jgi:hypothetical protein
MTILMTIYGAALVATTVLTVTNYERSPDSNITLTILAHVFWPITLLAFLIWLLIEIRAQRLHKDWSDS